MSRLLYLIQLPNGNYSYVLQNEEGNFISQDKYSEEVPYYVNDFYDTSIREI
jgi:hypothetical protein